MKQPVKVQQGITNRPVAEERREQRKLTPRDDRGIDAELMPDTHPEVKGQTSAGKTGMRSGSRKQAIANRGGIAPGKARPKAGAFSKDNRRRAS